MIDDSRDRLQRAIEQDNLLTVKRLLRRYPELLTSINPTNGWSPLHYAGYKGAYLICVHILSLFHSSQYSPADVLHRDFEGLNPLHLATKHNHEQTVHLMIQRIPNSIDSRDKRDRTSLMIAAEHNCGECLRLLIDVGANLNAVDCELNTALHYGSEYGHISIIRDLIFAGAKVDVKNKKGWRPIDVCNSDIVEQQFKQMVSNFAEEKELQQRTKSFSSSSSSAQSSYFASVAYPLDSEDVTSTHGHLGANGNQLNSVHNMTEKRLHTSSLPPLPTVTAARRRGSSTTTRAQNQTPNPSSNGNTQKLDDSDASPLSPTGSYSRTYSLVSNESVPPHPSSASIGSLRSLDSNVSKGQSSSGKPRLQLNTNLSALSTPGPASSQSNGYIQDYPPPESPLLYLHANSSSGALSQIAPVAPSTTTSPSIHQAATGMGTGFSSSASTRSKIVDVPFTTLKRLERKKPVYD